MITHTSRLLDSSIRRGLRAVPPRTPDQLRTWVRVVLGFDVPRLPLVAGHDAPLAYLCHAFFEAVRPPSQPNALVWAARGSGKTQLGAIATLLDLLFKPGIEICILGGSFAQSSRMHQHLRRMLQDEAMFDLIDGRMTLQHVRLRNGSRVQVLSQSQTAVRGLRAHRLRCDEVEEFESEVWEAAQLITRSGRCGDIDVRAGVEALSTMHRPFGLMNRLIGQASHADSPSNMRLFRWSAMDVLEHCPPSRLCESCGLYDDGCGGAAKRVECRGFFRIDDALDQRLRVSPQAWRAEMLCDRPDVSDCVYPEFDESLHVFDDDDAVLGDETGTIEWLGGLGFGFRSPSVLLLAALDGANSLRIMDEIVERSCITQRMIELAKARCGAWRISISTGATAGDMRGEARGVDSGVSPRGRLSWIAADPAGNARNDQSGVSNIMLWKRAGFAMRTRSAGIEAGIENVRARLRGPGGPDGTIGLRVHRRCGALIRALREYHFDPARPSVQAPVKDGPDHAADALRYLIAALDGAGSEPARFVDY